MTVFAPSDPIEASLATTACVETPGPCYLRLGKGGEPAVHQLGFVRDVTHAIRVTEGNDVTILASAGTLAIAREATLLLRAQNINVDLLSLPCVQPLDFKAVADTAKKTGRVITMEAHGTGGLGTIVAEFLTTSGIVARFSALRFVGQPLATAGSTAYLSATKGLSVENTVDTAISLLQMR